MEQSEKTPGVTIERGKIAEIRDGKFVVESYTRGGVKTRPMEAVNQYVNEYTGEPPVEDKYKYLVGDEVYFFMFGDGRGMVLGKMIR